MDEVIENERFIIRRPGNEDAQFYFELMSHPNWIRNIANRNINSPEDALQYIQTKHIPHIEKYGFGSYVIIRKEDNAKVGSVGLIHRDFLDHPDIGYAVHHDFYRQGIATESCEMVMDNAKKNGFTKIYAFIVPDNIASEKVLQKLNFEKDDLRYIDEYKETLQFFSKIL